MILINLRLQIFCDQVKYNAVQVYSRKIQSFSFYVMLEFDMLVNDYFYYLLVAHFAFTCFLTVAS